MEILNILSWGLSVFPHIKYVFEKGKYSHYTEVLV